MKEQELKKKLKELVAKHEEYRVYNYRRAPNISEFAGGKVFAYSHVLELLKDK